MLKKIEFLTFISKNLNCELQDLLNNPREVILSLSLADLNRIEKIANSALLRFEGQDIGDESQVFISELKNIKFEIRAKYEEIGSHLQKELIKKLGRDHGLDFSKVTTEYLNSFQEVILNTRRNFFSRETSVRELMRDEFLLHFSNMALHSFINIVTI